MPAPRIENETWPGAGDPRAVAVPPRSVKRVGVGAEGDEAWADEDKAAVVDEEEEDELDDDESEDDELEGDVLACVCVEDTIFAC